MKTVRKENVEAYMKANRSLVFGLVGFWVLITWGTALVSNVLNKIVIAGAPLGMFLMQQTVMVLYVAMIFYYAAKADQLEKQYDVAE
jgi:putative solute:sodium symporter small subunit